MFVCNVRYATPDGVGVPVRVRFYRYGCPTDIFKRVLLTDFNRLNPIFPASENWMRVRPGGRKFFENFNQNCTKFNL